MWPRFPFTPTWKKIPVCTYVSIQQVIHVLVIESVCHVFVNAAAPEVSASLEKVLPPSLLAALLVGAVIGAIVVVVVMPILRRFFSKRHQTRGGDSIQGPVNLCSMEDSNIFKNRAADSK